MHQTDDNVRGLGTRLGRLCTKLMTVSEVWECTIILKRLCIYFLATHLSFEGNVHIPGYCTSVWLHFHELKIQ